MHICTPHNHALLLIVERFMRYDATLNSKNFFTLHKGTTEGHARIVRSEGVRLGAICIHVDRCTGAFSFAPQGHRKICRGIGSVAALPHGAASSIEPWNGSVASAPNRLAIMLRAMMQNIVNPTGETKAETSHHRGYVHGNDPDCKSMSNPK